MLKLNKLDLHGASIRRGENKQNRPAVTFQQLTNDCLVLLKLFTISSKLKAHKVHRQYFASRFHGSRK